MLRKFFTLVFSMLMTIGCCVPMQVHKTKWVISADRQPQVYFLKYSIDYTFSKEQQSRIQQAVDMWQWTCNGQCIFQRIQNWKFDNDISKDAIEGNTMLFLNVDSTEEFMAINKTILAYVNEVGGKIVKINPQRIKQTSSYGPSFRTVILHEIGHVIGMGHTTDPTSLMYPILTKNTKFCVDNKTAEHLKRSNASWNVDSMNVCIVSL